MSKIAFIYIACLLTLSSCAWHRTFYTPQIDKAAGQQKLLLHGAESVIAMQPNAKITLQLQKVNNRQAQLVLSVANKSEESFTFDPTQITAVGYGNAGAGKRLKVLTPKQVAKRHARDRALVAGLILTSGAAVAVANASDPGTYSPYCYDPFLWTSLALFNASEDFQPSPPPVFRSPDGLLRSHTLMPGEELQGIVKIICRPDFVERILLKIPVQGTETTFEFSGKHKVY